MDVHVWVHVSVTVEVRSEPRVLSAGKIYLDFENKSLTFTWDLPFILGWLVTEPRGLPLSAPSALRFQV